jgi:hypothetical protein
MKIHIDKLTESELIDLNNRVVARLKFLHHAQEIGISDCVSPKRLKCIMVRRHSGCRSDRAT